MAVTLDDIEKLKRAIRSGILRVRSEDDDVTYRSMDEMKEALRQMEAEYAGQSGATPGYGPRFARLTRR